jgi:hypothetical protein
MGLQVPPADVVAAEPPAERAAELDVGRQRRFVAPSSPGVVLTVVLLVAGEFLTVLSRRLWFFGDDIKFLLTRGTAPGYDRGLFTPHNEHWSTVLIVIFRGLFALFGLRYLPYALVVIALDLAVCVVVYLLLRRVGIRPWAGVVVCTFFAFFGAGAENTTWDFQIGFVGAILFGFLAILLWDLTHDLRFPLVPTWVASVLALMSAGIALPMLATLGVFVVGRRGVAEAARGLSVPVVVCASWLLLIGRQDSPPQRPSFGVAPLIPNYVSAGLTSVWDTSPPIPSVGAVILALPAAVALFGRWGIYRARHLVLAGLAGATVLFITTAVVRLAWHGDAGSQAVPLRRRCADAAEADRARASHRQDPSPADVGVLAGHGRRARPRRSQRHPDHADDRHRVRGPDQRGQGPAGGDYLPTAQRRAGPGPGAGTAVQPGSADVRSRAARGPGRPSRHRGDRAVALRRRLGHRGAGRPHDGRAVRAYVDPNGQRAAENEGLTSGCRTLQEVAVPETLTVSAGPTGAELTIEAARPGPHRGAAKRPHDRHSLAGNDDGNNARRHARWRNHTPCFCSHPGLIPVWLT